MEAWNSPPRVDVADVLRIESGIIGTTFTVVLSFTGNGKVLGRYEATTDEEVDAILDTISEMLASTEALAPAAPPRSLYADPEASAQERAEWVKSGGHLAWVWNEPERQWYELGTLGGKGVDAYAAPASNVVDGTTGVRSYRLFNGSESARDWLRGVWGYMGTLPSQKTVVSPSNDTANQDDARRIARFGVDVRGITISMGTIPVVSVFYNKTRSVKEYARFADGMENAGFWLVEAATHPWPMDVHFEGNLSRNLSDSEWKMLDEIVAYGLPEKMTKEYRNGLKRYESLRAEIAAAQAVSDPAQKPDVIVPFATIQQDRPRDTSDTLPDPALVGRIDGMLIARGLPAGRSGKAIATAIQTGNYNDILHTDNTNSRAIFTELTGVKLPKTTKGTKELFLGKPFSVKPGTQEKEVSPYEKAQRIAASTGHILWIPSRGISASEKAHLVSIGMIATATPNHTGEVGPGWLGKNTSVVHEAINRIDTTEEQ